MRTAKLRSRAQGILTRFWRNRRIDKSRHACFLSEKYLKKHTDHIVNLCFEYHLMEIIKHDVEASHKTNNP